MNTHAKNPMEELHISKAILKSSIKDMLAPRRPAFSSAFHWAGRMGVLSIVAAASAVTAHAQFIWNGGGSNSNWSTNLNWSGGSAPSNGAEIHFAGTINLNPFNDLNLTAQNANGVNGLFFDSGAGSFALNGNSITLSNAAHTPNGLMNNSSSRETINMPVLLSNAQTSQTWTAAGGDVIFNSTVNLGGNILTLTGSNAFVFNGTISDSSSTGSIIQNGVGVAFLNGVNTYAGNTIVSNGALVINGSIASAQTTVNQNGVLAGNGTIGGNLTNNGVLVPFSGLSFNSLNSVVTTGTTANSAASVTFGSGSQTLTVKGNYTQGATGVLAIFYGGPASSQHTSLTVQGQANLNGALLVVPVNGAARLTAGQQVPIVTAAGGVTGQFSFVEGPALLDATIVYEPTSVVLETSQGNLVSALSGVPGISGNLLSVAKGLDAAANDPRAAKIFAVLNSDNLNQLVKDVQHINPEQMTATSSVGSATSGVHLQNLQLRMQALQSGMTGFSAMGFHVTDNNASDTNSAYAGPSGPEGKGGKEVVPPPANNRWGTFITGAGEFDHVGDTQNARGFNLDSGGITLGVDYRFTDHFVAGIFAGYTYSGIDIADGGRIAVDAGKVGLYATYFDGGFYVNSAVQGGYDTYETNRSGLGGTAHSSPVGGDFNLLFAPGYNWTIGGLTFGPTSRFQYSYESTNGFTETGSLAPLTVGSQHSESIVSAFGMKASYDWKIGTTIIRPELRLEWEHEYGDTATSVGGQLASGAGTAFSVTGPQIGRDDLHVGAGFAVVFSERVSAYAYYDGQFFRTNYDSSTVTGGFRLSF